MKARKILAAILALGIVAGLSACSTPQKTLDSEQTAEPVAVSAKGELPIVDEPIELDILLSKNAGISDYENNEFYNWLEEQTGIKININAVPADDVTQKLNLMLSSGQDMPDIIMECVPMDLISSYADKNMFVDMKPYIETQGAYLSTFYEEHPEYEKSVELPDGRILGLPPIYPAGENMAIVKHGDVGGKLWINQTWLDALGLDTPTTTEEFYEVLKAFKEQDPNGNGEADEIPLIGAYKGGWDSLPEIYLCNSFLPYNLDNPYYRDDDGKVHGSYAQPEYREALQYLNRLVTDGLLDPVTYTQDNAQLKQLVEMDTCVVGAFASAASSMAVTPGTDRFKEYVALAPLKGPDGVQLTKERVWSFETSKFTVITSACENPEAAFKLLDFWHTEEVALRSKWGIEGEHWQTPAEGTIANNGEPAKVEVLVNLYGTDPTNVRSGTNFGDSGRLMGYIARSDDPYESERFYLTESQKYFPYLPKLKNSVVNYFYTPEDAKTMSEITGTLTTYVDEARTKFILGTMDISSDEAWEDYLAEIEKIGYQSVEKIIESRHQLAEQS